MSPASRASLVLLAAAGVSLAAAPPGGESPTSRSPAVETDSLLDGYLDRPGLRGMLADHLVDRAKRASGEERGAIADRLGSLYVELIAAATTDAERQSWEAKARDLLKQIPEAQSLDLRVELARATYAPLERQAERWRLRLIDLDQKAALLAGLRALKSQLDALAMESNRRTEMLERAEDSGRRSDRVVEELTKARQLRSKAYYFAGWTSAYLAVIGGGDADSIDAIKAFGWIIGGSGTPTRSANLDRLARDLLRYDHVARAAIGTAMALSARGDDVNAMRWLAALEESPDLPPAVRSQLTARKIAVLGAAKRWADLDRVVRQVRGFDRDGKPDSEALVRARGKPIELQPLDPTTARLLAVLVFEAELGGSSAEVASGLGRVALQDLVAKGELREVAALATRYGTAKLGGDGFVAQYLRGLQSATAADDAHRAAGLSPEEPARDPALVNRHREAAGLLEAAVRASDASTFPTERSAALLAAGHAFQRAGDLTGATECFIRAFADGSAGPRSEEALWAAIVALDRNANGDKSLLDKLDSLSVLYVKRYPASERAAALLVKRKSQTGVTDEEALAVLTSVGRDSPLFTSARWQASRILYRQFRAASEEARPAIAARFLSSGEDLLARERGSWNRDELDADGRRQSGQRVLTLLRQMLDVLLAGPTPEANRARATLAQVKTVGERTGATSDAASTELAFRRFQIAVIEADADAQKLERASLAAGGPEAERFLEAADRFELQQAIMRVDRAAAGNGVTSFMLRQLIDSGQRVISAMGRANDPRAARDPGVSTLLRRIADAAAQRYRMTSELADRELALRLDRMVLKEFPGTVDCLLRTAELAEAAGSASEALDAWRALLAAHVEGTPEWFRARYESIRLLAATDENAASAALSQHAVLYPQLGPPPWGEKLAELRARLAASKITGGKP